MYGLYAQDDWRLSEHVTLNVGAQYDYNTFTPNDHNNIAPRIGFAWDATHDRRACYMVELGCITTWRLLNWSKWRNGEDRRAPIT